CKSKACIRGNERGWACPWGVYMGRLDRNNDCGLCMECVRSCPNDNIALFARPFTSDIQVKGYDESWRVFIMLTLAFVYSVALMGPWGWIKDLANVSEEGNWGGFLAYAGFVTFTALTLFPAVYLGFVALSKWLAKAKDIPLKKLFIRYSYTLVPLGLLIMVAFSAPLIMVHGSYIISVISDPFGWGWNLFGTAEFPWKPLYPEYIPHVQIVLLLIGLYFSIKSGYRISRTLFEKRKQAMLSLVPLTVFLTGITIGFLRLYVG
ncbi:MAG: hypothetical protein ACE5PV_01250, partial [Candidatus Poribacteria bacterium]